MPINNNYVDDLTQQIYQIFYLDPHPIEHNLSNLCRLLSEKMKEEEFPRYLGCEFSLITKLLFQWNQDVYENIEDKQKRRENQKEISKLMIRWMMIFDRFVENYYRRQRG
jgi:hypothetical protein